MSDKERSLTSGESDMAGKIFKSSIVYGRVKVIKRKFMAFQGRNVAMTPNGNMYMPAGIYSDDYSLEWDSYKALFIHEMVHVWQFQNAVMEISDPALAPGGALLDPAYEAAVEGAYLRRGTTGSQAGQPTAYLYEYYLFRLKTGGYADLLFYGHEQQAAIIEDYFRQVYLGRSATRAVQIFPLDAYEQTLANFLTNPSYARDTRSDTERRNMDGTERT